MALACASRARGRGAIFAIFWRISADFDPIAEGTRTATGGPPGVKILKDTGPDCPRYVLHRLRAAGRGMINWHSWRIQGPPVSKKKPPLGNQPNGGEWPPVGGVWPRT